MATWPYGPFTLLCDFHTVRTQPLEIFVFVARRTGHLFHQPQHFGHLAVLKSIALTSMRSTEKVFEKNGVRPTVHSVPRLLLLPALSRNGYPLQCGWKRFKILKCTTSLKGDTTLSFRTTKGLGSAAPEGLTLNRACQRTFALCMHSGHLVEQLLRVKKNSRPPKGERHAPCMHRASFLFR